MIIKLFLCTKHFQCIVLHHHWPHFAGGGGVWGQSGGITASGHTARSGQIRIWLASLLDSEEVSTGKSAAEQSVSSPYATSTEARLAWLHGKQLQLPAICLLHYGGKNPISLWLGCGSHGVPSSQAGEKLDLQTGSPTQWGVQGAAGTRGAPGPAREGSPRCDFKVKGQGCWCVHLEWNCICFLETLNRWAAHQRQVTSASSHSRPFTLLPQTNTFNWNSRVTVLGVLLGAVQQQDTSEIRSPPWTMIFHQQNLFCIPLTCGYL